MHKYLAVSGLKCEVLSDLGDRLRVKCLGCLWTLPRQAFREVQTAPPKPKEHVPSSPCQFGNIVATAKGKVGPISKLWRRSGRWYAEVLHWSGPIKTKASEVSILSRCNSFEGKMRTPKL